MTIIGPRLNGRRAPVSLNDAEVLATVNYRVAVRGLITAMAGERRAVEENRSAYAIGSARKATIAAMEARTKALSELTAIFEQE